MSHPLNNALQRQIDPPTWNGVWLIFVTRMWTLMVDALRSHAPLPPCASVKSRRRIAAPCWRSMMLASTMLAPQWNTVPIRGMVDLRCWMTMAITASTVLLSCVQDLKMWQNVSSSFCSACFLKATLMCQGIPHVGHGVPSVVVSPHHRSLMDWEQLPAAPAYADVRSHPQITHR